MTGVIRDGGVSCAMRNGESCDRCHDGMVNHVTGVMRNVESCNKWSFCK